MTHLHPVVIPRHPVNGWSVPGCTAVRELGSGGGGTFVRATADGPGTAVAIKYHMATPRKQHERAPVPAAMLPEPLQGLALRSAARWSPDWSPRPSWLRVPPPADAAGRGGANVAPAADPGRACDVTVDVVGTVLTNGGAGTITYEWLRSDGETSGLLTEPVADGQTSTYVHLLWT